MAVVRGVACGLVVLGLVVGLGACGGSGEPGRADVVVKIKSDPGMAGSPDAAVECVADWYMTYASVEERKAFVAGESGDRGVERVAGTDEARAAILECLKGTAGTS
ncbi:hypothetical protein [Saccharothrix variisporea]|uniref:Lipoprotein n=1 Tax=Saccharothrix variisporea TaxID=543527 RepID=A0A495X4T8_9PSEU|nr:hypothetical protein [Saccharothrix variisporea]RKT69321.1 hypothetical protein DFJ66_2531 [Saccharothrix variisporea]